VSGEWLLPPTLSADFARETGLGRELGRRYEFWLGREIGFVPEVVPLGGRLCELNPWLVLIVALGHATHWPERLALGSLYLSRVGSPPALEIQVLANRVVQQTHRN
jgi:hypothetical protein